MPSSTSNSRRSALRCSLGLSLGLLIILGTESAVLRDHRAQEAAEYLRLVEGNPAYPLYQTEIRGSDLLELLQEADSGSILFAGNSVVETGIVPPVIRRSLRLKDDVNVVVFSMHGASALTVVEALLRTGAAPGVVILDISPRLLFPADTSWASAVADGGASGSTSEASYGIQARFSAQIERYLDHALRWAVPPTEVRLPFSNHLRAILDGWKHGYPAYRSAFLGNVIAAKMKDGSMRVHLLNRSPGYERFRKLKLQSSMSFLRMGEKQADMAFAGLLHGSRRLARRGSRVILVNMPLDAPLRRLDQELHKDRYRWLREELASDQDVSFLDLGADPDLASLPFYDGHHREYEAAVEASRITAELVRQFIPRSLIKE